MFILNNKPVFMVSVTQMKMGEAKFDPFYQNPIKKLSVQASKQCLVAFEQTRMTIGMAAFELITYDIRMTIDH